MPTLTGTTFQEFLAAVEQYYGSGSDQWVEIAQYGTTADGFVDIVNQLPGYEVVTNNAGNVIGYQRIGTETIYSAASTINSNVAGATSTIQTPATVTISQETGKVVATKGITGATGLQFVTKEVIPAIAAAGVGITLGKTIDSVLYNANPDFWDANGMSTLNPETWNNITIGLPDTPGYQALGTAFNLLYGLNPTSQKGQAYINQDALAYLALYMQQQGVFNGMPQYILPEEEQSALFNPDTYSEVSFTTDWSNCTGIYQPNVVYYPSDYIRYEFNQPVGSSDVYCGAYTWLNIYGNKNFTYAAFSESPFTVHIDTYLNESATPTGGVNLTSQAITRNGVTYYVALASQGWDGNTLAYNKGYAYSTNVANDPNNIWDIAYITLNGDYESEAPEGIGTQTGATVPVLNNDMTVAQVLAALQTQYPDLFNNAVTYSALQPDGTSVQHVYVPIAMPAASSATDTRPTGDGEYMSQDAPAYDPQTMPESVWQYIYDIINKDNITVDETTGGGDTPAVVAPTGSASALWKIYNPSQTQLDNFGAWLWSSDFVDQLLKVFNDPMQAIIGLHKIFVTPPTSGSGAIKVGYLTSSASANYVTGQYVDVDCGSVTLAEYFNNVFDYTNTEVSIYLPFSGIHKLDIDDIMRGKITVVYHVDVLTGACLIDVNVTRDSSGGTIYNFTGNCAVQYPVSSGSYVGIVTGILGIAGGVAGTIATGGALAPMLMGAGASIGHMHTDVQHSGNISANAGAMGCKKPYLIIERGQPKTPAAAVNIEGLPQNKIVVLGSVPGYVKIKKAQYDGIPCTSAELDKIKLLLESGVYI